MREQCFRDIARVRSRVMIGQCAALRSGGQQGHVVRFGCTRSTYRAAAGEGGSRLQCLLLPLFSRGEYGGILGLMSSHRLLLEALPVSPDVSRLRAEGKITAEMTSVWIGFGAIELKREVQARPPTLSERRLLELFPVPAMRQAGAPSQAQRRPANVLVLLRQLPPHFIRLAGTACDSAGTADRGIAQADR